MSRLMRITALLLLLITAVAVLVLQLIHVPQEDVIQPAYTANSGELTGTTLIGQTFVDPQDNLSGIAIQFATYSDRQNTHPIELHVRLWQQPEDVRVIKISPEQLRDNQLYNFSFEPIPHSAGKTFFFYLVSPQSIPGNAVAIDIHTKDPYPAGTAFIAHGAPLELTSSTVISRSGKAQADLTFTLYHNVPFRIALLNNIQGLSTYISDILWVRAIAMAVALVVVVILLDKKIFWWIEEHIGSKKTVAIFLTVLFIIAFSLRLFYATSLPFTNDEGGYLYDARILQTGHLAGGDGYVKSPLVIVWIMVWQLIFGDTLLAGRLSSVVISALTLFPLWFLGTTVWNKRVGLTIAAIWALCGAAIVSGIYVHTQPLALFLSITGLSILISGFRTSIPGNASQSLLFLGGIFLGIGVASRKSILALGLVPLIASLLYPLNWKTRLRSLISIGSGFLLIIMGFLLLAHSLYGAVGITEALGINSAEDGITATDPDQAEQVLAYSIRGMTPFFRESLPLIMLSMLGLGLSMERVLRDIGRFWKIGNSKTQIFIMDYIFPKISWLFALGGLWWTWSFFNEYEGSAFMRFGIPWLWYGMMAVLIGGTVIPRLRKEALNQKEKPLVSPFSDVTTWGEYFKQDLMAALLIPAWFGGLLFFYMHWIKFHANYISEFIPPLVVLSGFGLYVLLRRLRELAVIPRWIGRVGIAVILIWAASVSNYITYLYEHTGTFDQKATKEAAQWAKDHIAADQTIFTGAALVPYLSGHRIALDIAHPRWYAYEFTRKDTHRLETFLPSAEKMVQAFRESEWFLMDQQTGFSFLMEYSEIEKSLATDFTAQTVIDNGGNPLTFYRRNDAQ